MPGRIPRIALDSALLQRVMTLTPLVIGGVLLVYSALRGFTTPLTPRGTLNALRMSVLGRSKRAVMAVLGPPRALQLAAPPRENPPYDDADTWYYALAEKERSAMALTFDRNIVHRVEFLRGIKKLQ